MNNEDNQGRELDAGKRIAESLRSIEEGPRKQVTDEELQKFKTASIRLDQMLKAAADADRQALRNASARLDQLLKDIRKGKDVTHRLKLRRDRQNNGMK